MGAAVSVAGGDGAARTTDAEEVEGGDDCMFRGRREGPAEPRQAQENAREHGETSVYRVSRANHDMLIPQLFLSTKQLSKSTRVTKYSSRS